MGGLRREGKLMPESHAVFLSQLKYLLCIKTKEPVGISEIESKWSRA